MFNMVGVSSLLRSDSAQGACRVITNAELWESTKPMAEAIRFT